MANLEPFPGWRFHVDDAGILRHEERTDVKFKIATGFWRWLLNRFGAAAITMPWRTIYVIEDHWLNRGLRRHELVHIEQIEREGPVMFTIKYLYWLVVRGYWDNPFELEAYGKEPIHEE